MQLQRDIAIELLRALCVLAVLFLNFAHAPMAGAAHEAALVATVDGTSFCGVPFPAKADHAPCDACRIGNGTALPEPCVTAEPAGLVAAADYDDAGIPSQLAATLRAASARAPPLLG